MCDQIIEVTKSTSIKIIPTKISSTKTIQTKAIRIKSTLINFYIFLAF